MMTNIAVKLKAFNLVYFVLVLDFLIEHSSSIPFNPDYKFPCISCIHPHIVYVSMHLLYSSSS